MFLCVCVVCVHWSLFLALYPSLHFFLPPSHPLSLSHVFFFSHTPPHSLPPLSLYLILLLIPPSYPFSIPPSLLFPSILPYFSSLPLTLLPSSPALLLMRCTADSLTPGDLINHPQVRELLRSELRNVCTNFKSYERPLGWAAVLEPFSQVRTHVLTSVCIQPYIRECTYNCNSNIFASISFE